MKIPDRFTKIKVAVGYIALLSILFFALWFIDRELDNLSRLDSKQITASDSLLLLIREKDQHTIQTLQELTEANVDLLDTIALQRLLSKPVKKVVAQPRVQHKVVESKDSLIAPVRKKGFLQRVAEVFAPSKDSTIVLNSSMMHYTDTLLERYRISSEAEEQLTEQVKELNRRRIAAYKQITKSNRRLRVMNEKLTAQIDSLVRSYELEAEDEQIRESQILQETRRRSIYLIVTLAVGAIILAIFFVIIIWLDITRSRRYRRELEAAKAHAEELLLTREKLMLTITHDFKAPLGSIIGYIELLSRLVTDKREKFYLDNMKGSSEHLLKLVNDLLDFHRLDLNKVEVQQVSFNPSKLFEDVKVSFEPLAKEKGLQLGYEADRSLNQNYLGDPLRIRQIVINLLSNAIKFTPKGNVWLKVGCKGEKLVIEVKDTGKGMSPEDKERIFQEFSRLPDAQGEEGFGLGLSIVHKLIHLMDGTIDVKSRAGAGSTFTVTLPVGTVSATNETEGMPEAAEEEAAQLSTLRVLLIDDDNIQLNLTAAMLRQKGISAVCCLQLEELIEYLRRETFDLLLTDLQMPGINGIDLVKLLRASNIPQAQTIPIVAVTARTKMREQELADYGFAACLNKPFSIAELMAVVSGNALLPSERTDREMHELDLSALTAFSEGDQEASNSIILSFISETRKNLKILSEGLAAEDAVSIANIAHKMLPLFTLIHASEVVQLLSSLEEKRNDSFSAVISEKAKRAITLIEQVLEKAEQKVG